MYISVYAIFGRISHNEYQSMVMNRSKHCH